MPRHKFTKEEARRGGWTRARQKAHERSTAPTTGEANVIKACKNLGLKFIQELEVWTGDYPQFLDIAVLAPVQCVIEINGGRYHWTGKMKPYDERKLEWCEHNGIPFLWINGKTARTIRESQKAILKFLEGLL